MTKIRNFALFELKSSISKTKGTNWLLTRVGYNDDPIFSFCRWVGQPGHVEEACQLAELSWARGMGACRRLFESG